MTRLMGCLLAVIAATAFAVGAFMADQYRLKEGTA